VVKFLSKHKHCFFLGKHYQLAAAYEASLKLKEISYIHSEAYSSAELKHGPLSLLDSDFPVIALCPNDEFFDKNISNIHEAKARKAPIVTISDVEVDL
jgi:glucosamine--fructose-6-phosphate aminotransferase (isomerizing)